MSKILPNSSNKGVFEFDQSEQTVLQKFLNLINSVQVRDLDFAIKICSKTCILI